MAVGDRCGELVLTHFCHLSGTVSKSLPEFIRCRPGDVKQHSPMGTHH